jgi:hypothetical protein
MKTDRKGSVMEQRNEPLVLLGEDAAGIRPQQIEDPCNMPVGWGRLCMLRGDHRASCLPAPHRIYSGWEAA